MGGNCVAWTILGANGYGTSIYPWRMNWLFGPHTLWRDTLLSLDTREEGLGPASSDGTDFVDSLWEASPSSRNG